MPDITVEVTQEDIDKGVAGNPCLCPIARAVRRELDIPTISTDVSVYSWTMDALDVFYTLPASAERFVTRFDYGDSVEPFTFTATEWNPEEDDA